MTRLTIAQARQLELEGHAIRIAEVFGSDGKKEETIIEHYLSCKKCLDKT